MFPYSGAHESMNQFQQLKQICAFNQYIDNFKEWMTMMKQDHNYPPEYFFTLHFISCLKYLVACSENTQTIRSASSLLV
jgi:hypothetical protein